jgi:Gas vesicle synthesis protein GvpL/GvpF
MSTTTRDDAGSAERAPSEDQQPVEGVAHYVYGIVSADAIDVADLGEVGLDGSRVHLVVQGRIGALVHDCPARPYDSGGEAAAVERVLAHHRVLQLAMSRWGSVLPMTFNTIVAPSEGRTADENLLGWLETEHGSLRSRVEALAGKAEFGLQVSYAPAVILRRVAEEVPEIRRLEEEAKTRSAGLAYFSRQEIERVLRREMEQRVRELFTTVYERARACSDRVTVEKVKKDGSDLRMAANLSCLVALDRYPELKALADEVAGHEGQTVRLVGPLPPYSFC